jgi:uncharacterized small protein (DUF1192 family)
MVDMEFEDLEPRKQPVKPRDLAPWSIGELNDYIARLESEIARARAAIAAKSAHRASVDGLFKK